MGDHKSESTQEVSQSPIAYACHMAQSYGHNNNRVVDVSIFNLCLHTTMLVSGRQTFPIVQIHSN